MARRDMARLALCILIVIIAAAQAEEGDALQKEAPPGEAGAPMSGYASPRDKRTPERHPRVSNAWPPGGEAPEEGSQEGIKAHGGAPPPSTPGSMFWVTRGKRKPLGDSYYYWGPNQNVWGERPFARWSSAGGEEEGGPGGRPQGGRSSVASGWESNQSLWGKRGGGPFWIARGKRLEEELGEEDQGETAPWGKVDNPRKRQDGGGPFWITRGKKETSSPGGEVLWVIRGEASPRGKKEGRGPFWVARGKRDGRHSSSPRVQESPYSPRGTLGKEVGHESSSPNLREDLGHYSPLGDDPLLLQALLDPQGHSHRE